MNGIPTETSDSAVSVDSGPSVAGPVVPSSSLAASSDRFSKSELASLLLPPRGDQSINPEELVEALAQALYNPPENHAVSESSEISRSQSPSLVSPVSAASGSPFSSPSLSPASSPASSPFSSKGSLSPPLNWIQRPFEELESEFEVGFSDPQRDSASSNLGAVPPVVPPVVLPPASAASASVAIFSPVESVQGAKELQSTSTKSSNCKGDTQIPNFESKAPAPIAPAVTAAPKHSDVAESNNSPQVSEPASSSKPLEPAKSVDSAKTSEIVDSWPLVTTHKWEISPDVQVPTNEPPATTKDPQRKAKKKAEKSQAAPTAPKCAKAGCILRTEMSVQLTCTKGCTVNLHSSCWVELRFVPRNHALAKLRKCTTTGCSGILRSGPHKTDKYAPAAPATPDPALTKSASAPVIKVAAKEPVATPEPVLVCGCSSAAKCQKCSEAAELKARFEEAVDKAARLHDSATAHPREWRKSASLAAAEMKQLNKAMNKMKEQVIDEQIPSNLIDGWSGSDQRVSLAMLAVKDRRRALRTLDERIDHAEVNIKGFHARSKAFGGDWRKKHKAMSSELKELKRLRSILFDSITDPEDSRVGQNTNLSKPIPGNNFHKPGHQKRLPHGKVVQERSVVADESKLLDQVERVKQRLKAKLLAPPAVPEVPESPIDFTADEYEDPAIPDEGDQAAITQPFDEIASVVVPMSDPPSKTPGLVFVLPTGRATIGDEDERPKPAEIDPPEDNELESSTVSTGPTPPSVWNNAERTNALAASLTKLQPALPPVIMTGPSPKPANARDRGKNRRKPKSELRGRRKSTSKAVEAKVAEVKVVEINLVKETPAPIISIDVSTEALPQLTTASQSPSPSAAHTPVMCSSSSETQTAPIDTLAEFDLLAFLPPALTVDGIIERNIKRTIESFEAEALEAMNSPLSSPVAGKRDSPVSIGSASLFGADVIWNDLPAKPVLCSIEVQTDESALQTPAATPVPEETKTPVPNGNKNAEKQPVTSDASFRIKERVSSPPIPSDGSQARAGVKATPVPIHSGASAFSTPVAAAPSTYRGHYYNYPTQHQQPQSQQQPYQPASYVNYTSMRSQAIYSNGQWYYPHSGQVSYQPTASPVCYPTVQTATMASLGLIPPTPKVSYSVDTKWARPNPLARLSVSGTRTIDIEPVSPPEMNDASTITTEDDNIPPLREPVSRRHPPGLPDLRYAQASRIGGPVPNTDDATIPQKLGTWRQYALFPAGQ